MAIAFLKQPLTYFNVFEPAIFEFSSDADLGVNVTELVADLQITSQVTDRRYLIKNIPPNYGTGVFRIDVSGYLKALMLDNFNYDFDSPNAQHTIEKYSIGVDVHADNASDTLGDEYVFDSGYVFDTTFIFAQDAPNDSTSNDFYAVLGVTDFGDGVRAPYSDGKPYFLFPQYTELFASQNIEGARLSTYTEDSGTTLASTADGVPFIIGVASIEGVQQINVFVPSSTLPYIISTTEGIGGSGTYYGITYQPEECEDTIQLRFFNSYGGYTYFYGAREADTGSRSGSKFVNNNFYNVQDGETPQKLRTSTRKKSFTISGNKNVLLYESFQELLNSPSIFVLLESGYTECEVIGSASKRKNDFEFSLTIDISNINTMNL